MKFILFLCLLHATILTSRAQIFADFSTTLGDFTAELDYSNSPLTVANFISLAQGSRSWVDSKNGAVRVNTPYYNGIIFHRVITGFVNQAGSQNGLGTDSPGYTFPDEVSNGLSFDTPYLLAMANSGPNTNGSQFFITLGTPSNLNGVHTIFGSITSGREVIDTINTVATDANNKPTTPVTINSVTIRRVGVEATAFDEAAQLLPIVQSVSPAISFSARTAILIAEQLPQTTLRIYSSPDLVNWSPQSRYLDSLSSIQNTFDTGTSAPQQFFFTSKVNWPADAIAPESYLGKKLTITANGSTFVLNANPPGSPIIGTLSIDGGNPSTITELSHEEMQGYGSRFVIFSENFVPIRFNIGFDQPAAGRVTGTAFTNPTIPLTGTFILAPSP